MCVHTTFYCHDISAVGCIFTKILLNMISYGLCSICPLWTNEKFYSEALLQNAATDFLFSPSWVRCLVLIHVCMCVWAAAAGGGSGPAGRTDGGGCERRTWADGAGHGGTSSAGGPLLSHTHTLTGLWWICGIFVLHGLQPNHMSHVIGGASGIMRNETLENTIQEASLKLKNLADSAVRIAVKNSWLLRTQSVKVQHNHEQHYFKTCSLCCKILFFFWWPDKAGHCCSVLNMVWHL